MNPGTFLTAEWRNIVMLNYAIAPELLAPHVPRGTELDLFEGQALVSIVAFHFTRTRVLGVPVPGHQNFPEVNLRFYVRRTVGGEVRRGAVFIGELVPKRAVAWVARTFYQEPYSVGKIASNVSREQIEYFWRFEREYSWLFVNPMSSFEVAQTGSIEQFITEHYWGYTRQKDGGTKEYAVQHPAWRVQGVNCVRSQIDVETMYGAQFGPTLRKHPVCTLVAEGSAVSVSRGVRIA